MIKLGKKENPATERKDPNIARLENTLAEQVGSPVNVDYDESGRGALRIQFQNLEILDGILQRLGVGEKSY